MYRLYLGCAIVLLIVPLTTRADCSSQSRWEQSNDCLFGEQAPDPLTITSTNRALSLILANAPDNRFVTISPDNHSVAKFEFQVGPYAYGMHIGWVGKIPVCSLYLYPHHGSAATPGYVDRNCDGTVDKKTGSKDQPNASDQSVYRAAIDTISKYAPLTHQFHKQLPEAMYDFNLLTEVDKNGAFLLNIIQKMEKTTAAIDTPSTLDGPPPNLSFTVRGSDFYVTLVAQYDDKHYTQCSVTERYKEGDRFRATTFFDDRCDGRSHAFKEDDNPVHSASPMGNLPPYHRMLVEVDHFVDIADQLYPK